MQISKIAPSVKSASKSLVASGNHSLTTAYQNTFFDMQRFGAYYRDSFFASDVPECVSRFSLLKNYLLTVAGNFCTGLFKMFSSADKTDKIFAVPCEKFTPEFLEKLSPEMQKSCMEYLMSDKNNFRKMSCDAEQIMKYGDMIIEGLNKRADGKKYKFISIGQSPSVFGMYLDLRGLDTAVCPISGLKCKDRDLASFLANHNLRAYFDYLKNFGLDLKNIDKDTMYVFTDFVWSGKSLRNFRKIIEPELPKGTDAIFVSLSDIAESGAKYPADKEVLAQVNMRLMDCDFKEKYSPIFRLNYTDMQNIFWHHKFPKNKEVNVTFNKLKFLIYTLLENDKAKNI